jgi:hypothetical protein
MKPKPYKKIECDCKGHRESISPNDCICSSDNAIVSSSVSSSVTDYSRPIWQLNEEAMEKGNRLADVILGLMLLMTAMTLVGLLMMLFS